jgi:vacuolar protein sorting-associated protein VTA1
MSIPAVIPNSLKIVTSVIRRAEELEKDQNRESKIVAYYCRVYVVTKGSKICGSDPEAGKFLIGQMEILEKVKPTLDITKEQGQEVCRNFAATVFNKADEEDRAGMADKATAKIYYAAGSFYDILEQFGDIDNEVCRSPYCLIANWSYAYMILRRKKNENMRNGRPLTS